MGRVKATGCGALVLVIIALGLCWLGNHTTEPLRVVSAGRLSGPLRVINGISGVLIILPDGSLWRWGVGLPGEPKLTLAPEEIGFGHHWRRAAVDPIICAAIDDHGGLWGLPFTNSGSATPLHTNQDWVNVVCGHDRIWVGLKRDGTIWGGKLSQPSAFAPRQGLHLIAAPFNPIRIGTNSDWKAICGSRYGEDPDLIGLRADGTLWSWSPDRYRTVLVNSGGEWGWMHPLEQASFETPFRTGSGSNWAGMDGRIAWANDGRVYWAFASPNQGIPALGSSNLLDGRFAVGPYSVYVVRTNGTLWRADNVPPDGRRGAKWRRVGHRSDWVCICATEYSFDNTFLGLTSDGMLWAWGTDWGASAAPSFWRRLVQFANSHLGKLRISTSSSVSEHKDPWPLMRLVVSTNNG
jgi:hypothetical protein